MHGLLRALCLPIATVCRISYVAIGVYGTLVLLYYYPHHLGSAALALGVGGGIMAIAYLLYWTGTMHDGAIVSLVGIAALGSSVTFAIVDSAALITLIVGLTCTTLYLLADILTTIAVSRPHRTQP